MNVARWYEWLNQSLMVSRGIPARKARHPPRGFRPLMEFLEDRCTPTVVSLAPVADNTLYQDSSGNLSNGAGQHFFVGDTGQATNFIRRGLIKFDLSSIPAGSTINGVTLTLHLSKTNAGAETISLHAAKQDWGEGSSNAATGGVGSGEGDGIQASTGDATWTYAFFNSQTWTNPGGNFSSMASAATSVNGIGSYQWTGPGLITDVQSWLNNPSTNFGWVLTGNESTTSSVKEFDSKENSTAVVIPALLISFGPPSSDLTITKSHANTFTQGAAANTYQITVGNRGPVATSGTVTVTDTLPTGLSPTPADSGAVSGWTVSTTGQTITASRSDALVSNGTYPVLIITVAVAADSPLSVTNTATVSGGGETNTSNDSSGDPTTILPSGSVLPTSTVNLLPALQNNSAIALSWSGQAAAGSTIASFDVFVGDNGGLFTAFLKGTTHTSTTFTGQNGHVYGFYSVATDNLGRHQSTPSKAQATTKLDTVAPTSSVAVLPAFSKPGFIVSWSGTDDAGGSGIANYSVFVSDNGGAFSAFQTNTTQLSSIFNGVVGHIYGFYSIATDRAGSHEVAHFAAQAKTNASLDTANKQYVARVYLDLLGRPVDLTGLSFWSGRLSNGEARSIIAAQLTHSEEYFATIIKPAYLEFLGRATDGDGLAFWTSQMRGGLTDERLEAGFIASPEYYTHDGGTDKGWIDGTYLNLLGRRADASGESFWIGQAAIQGRFAVALGFAASAEREAQRITADYSTYLHRQADLVGLAFWSDQFINHGKTNEDMITGFIASDEYFANSSK
jgi:uncharacterized repeat protein (TIGR01451 family)